MWSLNNLASKAAEAINVAKKGITEISKESPHTDQPQEKRPEISMNMLKKQCLKYKDEIDRLRSEIIDYKKVISDLHEIQGTQTQSDKLINFKIIIGKEDSEEDQKALYENSLKITELTEKFNHAQDELTLVKKLSADNLENFKQEIESQLSINSDLVKENKILKEQCQSCQEALLKYKSRIQMNVVECYKMLKVSFTVIGLNLPQINPENLGQEDLQEFIYTQGRYIEDSMKAISGITGSYNKQCSSLETLKQVLAELLNESSVKTKESMENAKKSESVSQKILKEKEDLHKMMAKKDERLKITTDEVRKLSEDNKILESFKAENVKVVENLKNENSRLQQRIKNLMESKEVSDKSIEELKIKLKKTSDYIATIEETNANLNIRIKFVNSTIIDKESLIRSLNEQIASLNSQNSDLQSCLDEYKATSEKNVKEVNDMYSKKILDLQEATGIQIADLKVQLSKALNEAKDAGIAKIQSAKYQQAGEKLQEIVKNLELQSSNHIQKMDKITLQNENNLKIMKKRKDKINRLKEANKDLGSELSMFQQEFQIEREQLTNKAKESEMVRYEAEALLKRIETQIQASDSMIDKRLISTFLINYLSESKNARVKVQMLRALAEMLGLNHEQRVKIGLVQEQGIFSQLASYITRS